MFVKIHRFLRKTHSYFSKNNLRLLSLLGIAFALVITVVLVQQQQDIRQLAKAPGEQLCGGVYCSGIGTPSTCVKIGSNSYGCITPNTLTPGQGCADQNNKPNNNACKSGICSAELHCSAIPEDQQGNNASCSPQNPQGCPIVPLDPSDPNVSCDPFNNCTIKCGGKICNTNESCMNLPSPFTDQCIDLSSYGGNSGGNTPPGNTPPGGSSGGIPAGAVACGNPGQYCDAGKYCVTQNGVTGCCDQPNCGNSTGSSGGTCANSSQTLCGGQCWSCGNAGIDCKNNTGVCKNNGCASGQVAVGNKCCPSGTTALCGDGTCGPCAAAVIIPNPQPNDFSLSKPVPDCDRVALSWGSTNADSFTIETNLGNNTLLKSDSVPAGTYKFTVTGLQKNTIYLFGITAHSSTLGTKKTLVQTIATLPTCKPTTGTTTATTPKTTTSTAPTTNSNNTNTAPVAPKTATPVVTTAPTITTTIAPSITANTATLSLSLTLPGVGNASEFKNPNPKRTQRTVSVSAIDTNNTAVTAQNNLTFDSSSNSYKGTVSIPSLPAGTYTIKVRFDNTLWKKLPGNIVITNGNNNPTSTTAQLISGDLDQNNSLNVLDYTNFVKCYKGLSSCTTTLATLADLDDDGSAKDDLDDLTILQQGFNTQTQGD